MMLKNSKATKMISRISKCKLFAANNRSAACSADMSEAFCHTTAMPRQMKLIRDANGAVTTLLLGTPNIEKAQMDKTTWTICSR